MSLVVFHDHGAHVLDPLLKEGFRHCFCVVDDGSYQIKIDGLAGLPHVEVVAPSGFDLMAFYAKEGFTVVEVANGAPPNLPLTLTNCVGLVKAVLGIQAFGVLTPYQLYRRLTHDAIDPPR